MRITRDILLDHARERTALLTAQDRGIICVYVSGSLLQEDPLIGGITDIDLICIHDRPSKTKHEIIRLNPDINLDVAHYEQEDFEPARKLRTDAWIGGWLENVPLVLYDALRWYDFTRASATAQFWKPDNIAARVRSFLVPARKTWTDLTEGVVPQGISRTFAFLTALRNSANAIAVITGAPLAERRLVHELPARANAAGLPFFSADFVQLFTSNAVTDENFAAWVNSYHQLFDYLKENENIPVSLQPCRRTYYENAIRALYPVNPAGAIWLMFYTWTKAANVLPKDSPSYKNWQSLASQLELDSENLPARLAAFDPLLDSMEDMTDRLTR